MSAISRLLMLPLALGLTACIIRPVNPLTNLASARVGQPPALMKLSSPAFAPNTPIPDRHSAYGVNASPPLEWSGHPATTRTFALVMEDPDARFTRPEPFVHWVIFNVPGTTTSLPATLPVLARLDEPGGALQGHNGMNTIGYFGPRPPSGDVHRYHFTIFALDIALPLTSFATKGVLVEAMKGHIVGRGELIGTYER